MSSVDENDIVLDLLIRCEELNWLATPAAICEEAGCPELVEQLRSAVELLDRTKEQAVSQKLDERITISTSYQTQSYLDQGGMGTVYQAKDEVWNREVAIKVVRDDRLNGQDLRRRFLEETKITAQLDHPGVIPIYGQGPAEDGRPLCVMRLVRGMTLLEVIARLHQVDGPAPGPDGRAVDLPNLLTQFVSVCNTVAYAHSKGILHRDLTPRNIMTGAYGETLVMDWGLAKQVDDDAEQIEACSPGLPGSPSAGSKTRGIFGTPGYRSPEHMSGKPESVSPASDIYSLGAMLYHLITGHAPQEGGNTVVGLAKAPKPLLAVCMKGMDRSPSNRYKTPLDLAADVQNWLADKPVSAYPEPWLARMGRWIRKHKTLVGNLLASLTIIVAILAISTVLLKVANDQKLKLIRQVGEERDHSREIMNVVQRHMTLFLTQAGGKNPLSDEASSPDENEIIKFEQEIRAVKRDAESQLRSGESLDKPFITSYAYMIYKLGSLRESVDSPRDAIVLYREAADILEPISRTEGGAEHRIHLAKIFDDLGQAEGEVGLWADSLASHERAIAIRNTLLDNKPDDSRLILDLALSNFGLALSLARSSQIETAEAVWIDSNRLADRAAAMHQNSIENKTKFISHILSISIANHISIIYAMQSHPEKALEMARRAKSMIDVLAKENPEQADTEPYLWVRAVTSSTLGRALCISNLSNESIVQSQEALPYFRSQMHSSKSRDARRAYATCAFWLAVALQETAGASRQEEWEDLMQEAQGILKPLAAVDGAFEDVYMLASVQGMRAMRLVFSREFEQAIKEIQPSIDALGILHKKYSNHLLIRKQLATAYSFVGFACENLGRFTEGLANWDRAIALTDQGDNQLKLKLGRLPCLAGSGQVDEAVKEAWRLQKIVGGSAFFPLAKVLALYSDPARQDKKSPILKRLRDAQLSGLSAVGWLRNLLKSGYPFSPSEIEDFRQSAVYEPIRMRPDFQQFLHDVEASKK